MFTSFISVSAILLAASLVSAASLPEARTTFDVCAICPSVDTEGNTLSPISNFGLTPPEKFCGYGDLGANGFITSCFYDNTGALTQGTAFCPPGPVAVNTPPNCLEVTE
ncbi:hypothetical protein BT96DRAFT_1025468 [Gymnopus androsaceus JB14]|uniref:Uncharacterized protein n=1 Tax=Gymnopus androsaceus JB14 TaxID=1447944 RepID=A0A6A4GRN2_9AGAR|nr:hypothetical protein BT96DRAFT_981065 [Gymnopus androsaceus JB14]KAE9388432.1 hypothetical protein BT96DRAFT_1025468 [Gymnopus androsaceus JB14]